MRGLGKFPVILIIVCLAGGLVFPHGSYGADKISFGFSLPLTGELAETGLRVLDSYKFWAKKLNSQGGLLIKGKRYPVELVFYDDEGNPEMSAKLTEKLVTVDGVDLLLGGIGNAQVSAAGAIAEKYRFPMISGGVSSDKLFEQGFTSLFSTLSKETEQIQGCVKMLKALNPKPGTVAIIGPDTAFGSSACDGFRKYSKMAGFTIEHFELFPVQIENYSSMLLKIKMKNPDVLFVSSQTSMAIKIVKAMKETGFTPKAVIFSYGPTSAEFVKSLGKDADDVFAPAEWTPRSPGKGPVFGTAADFDKAYFKEYNRHPDYVEAAAAAAAVIQQLALEALKLQPPFDEAGREALLGKLRAIHVETFYGKVSFSKDGACASCSPVVAQVQEGKVVSVFPGKGRGAAPVYPMRAWTKR